MKFFKVLFIMLVVGSCNNRSSNFDTNNFEIFGNVRVIETIFLDSLLKYDSMKIVEEYDTKLKIIRKKYISRNIESVSDYIYKSGNLDIIYEKNIVNGIVQEKQNKVLWQNKNQYTINHEDSILKLKTNTFVKLNDDNSLQEETTLMTNEFDTFFYEKKIYNNWISFNITSNNKTKQIKNFTRKILEKDSNGNVTKYYLVVNNDSSLVQRKITYW